MVWPCPGCQRRCVDKPLKQGSPPSVKRGAGAASAAGAQRPDVPRSDLEFVAQFADAAHELWMHHHFSGNRGSHSADLSALCGRGVPGGDQPAVLSRRGQDRCHRGAAGHHGILRVALLGAGTHAFPGRAGHESMGGQYLRPISEIRPGQKRPGRRPPLRNQPDFPPQGSGRTGRGV